MTEQQQVPQPGTIYAIGAEGSPYVKIGSTYKPVQKRLSSLQTGHPARLRLLAYVQVPTHARRIEKAMHQILDEHRQYGEWFMIDMNQTCLEELVLRAKEWLEQKKTIQARRPKGNSRRRALHAPDAVGRRLLRLRETRGLTLRSLAQMADVPMSTINAVELGKRAGTGLTVATCLRLAQALRMSVGQLLSQQEDDEDDAPARLVRTVASA